MSEVVRDLPAPTGEGRGVDTVRGEDAGEVDDEFVDVPRRPRIGHADKFEFSDPQAGKG